MTDNELRAMWRQAGGRFHGPNVETGTMPEEKLLPFLRALASAGGAPGRLTFEQWWDSSKAIATPHTYRGWEESCRQAFEAGRKA